MKPSEYPPAELRYGENFLVIEECIFYCEDVKTGDPDNVTIWLRVKSGTFQAYTSCDCAVQQFCDFLKQLQKMYEFQCFSATLSAMYYCSNVTLTLDKAGHIKVEGKIFDDGMDQCLTFTFMIDQSALPPFISGLKNMIS